MFRFLICFFLANPCSYAFAESCANNPAKKAHEEEQKAAPAPTPEQFARFKKFDRLNWHMGLTLDKRLRELKDKHGTKIAIVSRVSQDMARNSGRKYYQYEPKEQAIQPKYDHTGFVVYDEKKDRFVFMHMLNDYQWKLGCLWKHNLTHFIPPDGFQFDLKVSVPTGEVHERLYELFSKPENKKIWKGQLYTEKYNGISNPFSTKYQNSNEWVLTVYTSALTGIITREKIIEAWQGKEFTFNAPYVNPSDAEDWFLLADAAPNFDTDDKPLNSWRAWNGWYAFVSSESVHDYVKQTIGDKVIEMEICPHGKCNVPYDELIGKPIKVQNKKDLGYEPQGLDESA